MGTGELCSIHYLAGLMDATCALIKQFSGFPRAWLCSYNLPVLAMSLFFLKDKNFVNSYLLNDFSSGQQTASQEKNHP